MTPGAHLRIDEQNPWPGLSAFDEAAQRFFNGRQEETAALRRLVAHSPLTVLFGASGLGKTSLLHAGLFPLLRRDFLPVYVRLDLRDSMVPLIDQVKAALETEIRLRRVETPEFRSGESLWEYLHRGGLELWSEQNQLLTPVFVFDQFEEVFTLGASRAAAVARLRSDLADLIENRVPEASAAQVLESSPGPDEIATDRQRYKVLLSFREDFLPVIEGWKREIPSIMRNRLRLLPMSGAQAFEAVHATAPALAPEPIAHRIVSFVAAAGEDSGEGEGDLAVEPALLSLLCNGLNERRKQQGKAQFDEALLMGTGQAIVADFYRDAVAGLPAPVHRFIERELITERGFRKPCDVDDALTVHRVSREDLARLVDRRLLRIEPVRGSERVELTHDLLTRVVREHREQQRERDRRRRRNLVVAVVSLVAVSLGVLAAIMGHLYLKASAAQIAAEEATRQAREASAEEFTQRQHAQASQTESERETRSALSHQLSGASVNSGGTVAGILFALGAIAATNDVDHVVLPDAAEALRVAIDTMHRAKAPSAIELALPGNTLRPTLIRFSRDHTRVVTVAGDNEVRVWDVSQGEEISTVKPGSCPILEFSQDLTRLACGGREVGSFFDLAKNQKLRATAGCQGCALKAMGFSPDGRLLVWEDLVATHITDGVSIKRDFTGHKAVVSPDGKILATITDQAVKLWDVASGGELRTLNAMADRAVFSPDGKQLAVNGPSGLLVFDLSSGTSTPVTAPGGNMDVRCIAFSPDLRRLAVLGLTTWQVADLPTPVRPPWSHSPVDTSVPHLLMAGTCGFGKDRVVINGRSDYPLTVNGHYDIGGGMHAEMWDTDSERLYYSADAVSDDGEVFAHIIDATVGMTNGSSRPIAALPARDIHLHAAVFSPDASQVVTSGDDRRARTWDVNSGRKLSALLAASFPITFAAYSPDGTIIVTTDGGSTTDGTEIAKLWDARSGHLIRNLSAPAAPNTPQLAALAFSPDGKRIVASKRDGDLITWDASTGAALPPVPPFVSTSAGPLVHLAFSGDGKWFAIAGNLARIWKLPEAKEVLPSPGPISPSAGMALSHDGRHLAISGSAGVRLWSAESGWKSLTGSLGWTSPDQVSLAFNRDGTRLAGPGKDDTLLIWNTATGQEVARLYYYQAALVKDVAIRAVAYSPDEKEIFALGANWATYRFTVPLEDLPAEARRLAGKTPLTDQDCAAYLHQTPCPPQVRRIASVPQ